MMFTHSFRCSSVITAIDWGSSSTILAGQEHHGEIV
jgi:hypothetical protein